MVYKCSVPNCRSGYEGEEKKKVSFFSFPLKNPDLLCKWVRCIHRKNFKPTKNHRVCSLHFREDDFQIARSDSNLRRKRAKVVLKQKALKATAFPSVFPNQPCYMTKTVDCPRPTVASTSTARLNMENQMITEQIESLLEEDIISCLHDLRVKFEACDHIPGDFVVYPIKSKEKNESLLFTKISVCPYPSILASVSVQEDLSFHAYDQNGKIISKNFERAMQFSKKILRFSDFLNLLAQLADTKLEMKVMVKQIINTVDQMSNMEEIPDTIKAKLGFIKEQLNLLNLASIGK